MTSSDRMKQFAPILLRIGLAFVFLWFGWMQLANTPAWVGLIPKWVTNFSGLEATTLVHFNGAFEIVFGLCLLFGFFTRVTSFLLALHMVHITLTLFVAQGLGGIVVRDIGLSIAAVALFLLGPHGFSVDSWLSRKSSTGYPPTHSQNR